MIIEWFKNKAKEEKYANVSEEAKTYRDAYLEKYSVEALKALLEGDNTISNLIFVGNNENDYFYYYTTVYKYILKYYGAPGNRPAHGTIALYYKDGKYSYYKNKLEKEDAESYSRAIIEGLIKIAGWAKNLTYNNWDTYERFFGQIKNYFSNMSCKNSFLDKGDSLKTYVLCFLNILYPEKFCSFYTTNWFESLEKFFGLTTENGYFKRMFLINNKLQEVVKQTNLAKEVVYRILVDNLWNNTKSKAEGTKEIVDDTSVKILKKEKKVDSNSGEESEELSNELKNLYNRIIFGAPGTGKSHKLQKDQEAYFNHQVIWKEKKEDKIEEEPQQAFERVTFHPDYYYSNFVGAYKPVMKGKDIEYKFIPGPFLRVYAKAKHNTKPVLLIIEEINRANVAAVFGDVFQLLDRKEDGESEYPIAASEDVKQWLAEHDIYETELSIPSNMYIWATMNSADQGVFPMDTAFKRRWSFEYRGKDEGENKANYSVELPNGQTCNWNELRKKINERLITEAHVNEDKCLGPFFVSEKDCKDATGKIFASKVLMYLFEDVVKQKPNKIFHSTFKDFSSIYNAFISTDPNTDDKRSGFGVFVDEIGNVADEGNNS